LEMLVIFIQKHEQIFKSRLFLSFNFEQRKNINQKAFSKNAKKPHFLLKNCHEKRDILY